MRRLLLLAAAVAGTVAAAMAPAFAAVRTVSVGNFYYDDDTPGDGVVQAQVGDQLRFVVKDNGPGTPHTVEVDELGIHSGSLGAGETFTTPVLDRPGTFRLYCKPHDQRGHVATLVVGGTAAPTTTTPPTTVAPAPPPTTTATTVAPTTATTAAKTTTTTAKTAVTASPTTTVRPAAGASSPPTTTGPTTTSSPGATVDQPSHEAEAESPVAPEGRGEATADELAEPGTTGKLDAILGRQVASGEPWTRSVRMGLVLLLPLAILATGIAAWSSRSRRQSQMTSRISPLAAPPIAEDRLAG